jgi:hypothetical protein
MIVITQIYKEPVSVRIVFSFSLRYLEALEGLGENLRS